MLLTIQVHHFTLPKTGLMPYTRLDPSDTYKSPPLLGAPPLNSVPQGGVRAKGDGAAVVIHLEEAFLIYIE